MFIGFSRKERSKKLIFESNRQHAVRNINGYLLEGENICVTSRSNPLCDVPKIGVGNQPIDDGNYLFSKDEMEEFIKKEPDSARYFRPWYGSREFINQSPRYCLWLGDCSPRELRKMPECMKLIENVREFRLSSKRAGTRKLADKPTHFLVENMPNTNYLLIPSTSSENRKYIPIGFMTPDNLASNATNIIANADLYHFGVLTSNVHMAWMRTTAGRLKSDYRYSKDIVYNNFPWPTPSEEQKIIIEKKAQKILEARALYSDSSLADLYDDLTMPPELRRAHQENDAAVMQAYGFKATGEGKMTEADCVAALMQEYQDLIDKEKK